MRRPRHLSPEERALWLLVARRAQPLDPQRQRDTGPTEPRQPDASALRGPYAAKADPAPPRPDQRPFRLGEAADHSRSDDLLPGLTERMRQAPVNMDARSFGKLRRGKLVPEGRIDLHGMTLSEAHPVLTDFILRAHAGDSRLVLVITGKGKVRDHGGPMPVRQGVLRHQVPQWLALPPLGGLVLQVTPAHLRHGGEGAWYVYLRRRR